jgi:hypothetical protein
MIDDAISNLGSIVWRTLLVTEGQLRAALEVQAHRPGRKLGELLVEMGAITDEDLKLALELQAGLRSKHATEARDAAKKLLEVALDRDAKLGSSR